MTKARPPAGRPPGRRGRGGVGPGPGYRHGGVGKGTRHKSSSSATTGQLILVYSLFIVGPGLVAATLIGYFLHGYGVL